MDPVPPSAPPLPDLKNPFRSPPPGGPPPDDDAAPDATDASDDQDSADDALVALFAACSLPDDWAVRYNLALCRIELSPRLRAACSCPPAPDLALRDCDVTCIRRAVRRNAKIRMPSVGATRAALAVEAHWHEFSPVADYLAGLPPWDGIPRIATWLPTATGCEDTPLHRAYGARSLVAMIARALNPGCKVDHILTLVGRTAARKGTLFEALAGQRDAFFEDTAFSWADPHAVLKYAGVWLYELSDCSNMTGQGRTATLAKGQITVKSDRYVAKYESYATEIRRRGVFVGTSEIPPIEDPVSSRRWWCVAVADRLDVPWVRRWRDQLHAEAKVAYLSHVALVAAGAEADDSPTRWWLSQEGERLRVEQQGQHREEHPLDAVVEPILLDIEAKHGIGARTTVAAVMRSLPQPDPDHAKDHITGDRGGQQAKAVTDSMRRLGWIRTPGKVKLYGTVAYAWTRDTANTPTGAAARAGGLSAGTTLIPLDPHGMWRLP